MFNSDTIESTIIGTITGDAAGRPLDSFTRENIKAVYKEITGYPDPEAALKNREDHWTKSGLYSSVSQFAILNLFCVDKNGFNKKTFHKIAEKVFKPDITRQGIFRNPDHSENNIITNYFNYPYKPFASPGVRIMAASIPCSFYARTESAVISCVLNSAAEYTSDTETLAGMLILNLSAFAASGEPDTDFTRTGISACREILSFIRTSPSKIFDNGFNPANLEDSIQKFLAILNAVSGITDTAETEKKICLTLNSFSSGSGIKRALVDRPIPLLAFILNYLTNSADKSIDEIILEIVKLGGKTSAGAAIAGGLYASSGRYAANSVLIENLVNRTRILKIASDAARGSIDSGLIDDFIDNEAAMTRKELEELNSRIKHKKPAKKEKIINTTVETINRHVVESWTKTDRARWKKNGQKTIKS